MKRSVLIVSASLAFLLVATVAPLMALPNECGVRLANNRYRCTVKDEIGSPPFELCFQFVSPGVESSKFDLSVNGISLGCSCKAGRGFSKPDFTGSKEFLCVDAATATAIEGKVSGNGKLIPHGDQIDEDGDATFFKCVLDPTCP